MSVIYFKLFHNVSAINRSVIVSAYLTHVHRTIAVSRENAHSLARSLAYSHSTREFVRQLVSFVAMWLHLHSLKRFTSACVYIRRTAVNYILRCSHFKIVSRWVWPLSLYLSLSFPNPFSLSPSLFFPLPPFSFDRPQRAAHSSANAGKTPVTPLDVRIALMPFAELEIGSLPF